MKADKALLIEWDPYTGERAGGINPRDKNLPCHGWQNMETEPAQELRLVRDDRDLEQYEGIEGVTVLRSQDDINAAIDQVCPPQLRIQDELIYSEHIKQKIKKGEIDIDQLPDDPAERLKALKEKHKIKGITEIKPFKLN